jgi:hypothetical protein
LTFWGRGKTVTRIPFSQEDLDEIFRFSRTRQGCLFSRENSTLEFKESFGWQGLSMYLKTCAAFANAKGGYLVFGVTNKRHRPVGLSGTSLQLFQDIDPEKMTQSFNDHFSPEIAWEIQEYELQGKTIGLMFVHESSDKPVMCIKNLGQDLHESDVYYRYRARSERIKYPELKEILETRRANEERLWMNHLENISRIGVHDAGVFDLHSGQVTESGGSFLIEESLLGELSFIKEDEFSEVRGKPTLRLVGSVEPIGTPAARIAGGARVVTKGIHASDIVLAFLDQKAVSEPMEFIRSICSESTAFLPVFYYMSKAGLDWSKTVEMLDGVVCRSSSRTKLIERLETDRSKRLPLSTSEHPATRTKYAIADSLRREEVTDDTSGGNLELCLQAMRSLSSEDVKFHSEYLRRLLKAWFLRHYSSATETMADHMRRTICGVDEALYDGGNA